MRAMRPTLRILGVSLVTALLLAACGSKPAPAPAAGPAPATPAKLDKVDLQLAWLMNAQSAAFASAVKQGIYKKYGLDVTLHAGGPNVDPIQTVVSGQMQFGIANSSGSLILARGQGLPVKALAAVYQKHPYAYFYKPDSGIKTPADLMGKRIGIQPTGHYLLTAFLGQAGLKESDVKVVMVGSDLTPLINNQVDATAAWVVNAAQVDALPGVQHFLTFDYGLRYFANVIFATDKTIQSNPDLVKRFVAASMEGLAFAMDNPAQSSKDVLASADNLTEAIERKTLDLSVPMWASSDTKANGLGYMNQDVWHEGMQTLVETNQMKAAIKVDDIFTNTYVTGNTPKR